MTPKQQRFVDEYLIDLNATQAAIRAGYSARNADKIGPELLGKTRIAQSIKVEMTARSNRTRITQDMVLEGLHLEASRMGVGASHSARVAAWAHIGKHLGMFADNLNLGTTDSLTALLEAIAARPRHRPVANGADDPAN